jgi:hypothetical protein
LHNYYNIEYPDEVVLVIAVFEAFSHLVPLVFLVPIAAISSRERHEALIQHPLGSLRIRKRTDSRQLFADFETAPI